MSGPLYKALQDKSGENLNLDNIMIDKQIQQLIVFMGTCTVISFIMVIALVTIGIAFIW